MQILDEKVAVKATSKVGSIDHTRQKPTRTVKKAEADSKEKPKIDVKDKEKPRPKPSTLDAKRLPTKTLAAKVSYVHISYFSFH